jgi:hypothetical protein
LRPRRDRAQRLLFWAFLFSIAFHLIAGPLLAWLLRARFVSGTQQLQPVETISITSSAIRLERRPQAQHPSVQPPAAQPPPHAIARAQPTQARHRELARITPRAIISVPRVSARNETQTQSFSQQLAKQQVQFTQTIARLREQNNPVAGAAQPVAVSPAKRYTNNFSGTIGSPNIGEGILYPTQSWQVGPWDYYYVRYWVLYPDGTSETGTVPWPVRFPQTLDPIKLGWRSMPLPGPEPGYVLPPDANPHPLVAFCYEHHFSSCPVAHD